MSPEEAEAAGHDAMDALDDMVTDRPVRLTCGITGGALYVRPSAVAAVRTLSVASKAGFVPRAGQVIAHAAVFILNAPDGFSVVEDADTVASMLWPGEVDDPTADPDTPSP